MFNASSTDLIAVAALVPAAFLELPLSEIASRIIELIGTGGRAIGRGRLHIEIVGERWLCFFADWVALSRVAVSCASFAVVSSKVALPAVNSSRTAAKPSWKDLVILSSVPDR